MSQAEALLREVISAYTVDPSNEEHIVVGPDRHITVPDALKRIAVQYDHNIETVTFDCPRYWDGIDMSQMHVYINYRRADNKVGSYLVTDVAVDESDTSMMHFGWTISRFVSEVKGNIMFLVCIKSVDETGNEKNHWNSELCTDCYISEGLETIDNNVTQQYPDIIAQLLEMIDGLDLNIADGEDVIEFLGEMSYVTPIVDSEGAIYTNNEGHIYTL